jgi:hypothetical protein
MKRIIRDGFGHRFRGSVPGFVFSRDRGRRVISQSFEGSAVATWVRERVSFKMVKIDFHAIGKQ